MFGSDRMSGSHFTVQTSKFLLIDATAVTLGQGHEMVIQYILPYLYIHCPKYLRCSSNVFDVIGKSCSGGGPGWQYNTTPDSKVHGATMGANWGRQNPGAPHVGPLNLAIRDTAPSDESFEVK